MIQDLPPRKKKLVENNKNHRKPKIDKRECNSSENNNNARLLGNFKNIIEIDMKWLFLAFQLHTVLLS